MCVYACVYVYGYVYVYVYVYVCYYYYHYYYYYYYRCYHPRYPTVGSPKTTKKHDSSKWRGSTPSRCLAQHRRALSELKAPA